MPFLFAACAAAGLFMGRPDSGADHTILIRKYLPLDSVEEVQAHAGTHLLAVDQEGGWLCHLRGAFTQFPGQLALGHIDDLDLTYRVGQALASELRAAGISMFLGPVLDQCPPAPADVMSSRPFSSDPEQIIAHAHALVLGLQPMICVGKHLPGHGATLTNTHYSLAYAEAPQLEPFLALHTQLPALMVGHIVIPGDPRPASQSPPFIKGVIRDQWGFDGLIVSDCLNMEALTGSLADRAVAAFEAGCDLLIFSHTEDLRSVIEKFASRVDPEAIERSLARIAALELPGRVPFESHQALANEVGLRALSPGPLEPPQGSVAVVAPARVREQVAEGLAPWPHIPLSTWDEPLPEADHLIAMVLSDVPDIPEGALVVTLGDPRVIEADIDTYSAAPASITALFSRFERGGERLPPLPR